MATLYSRSALGFCQIDPESEMPDSPLKYFKTGQQAVASGVMLM